VKELVSGKANQTVLVRGRVHNIRGAGKYTLLHSSLGENIFFTSRKACRETV